MPPACRSAALLLLLACSSCSSSKSDAGAPAGLPVEMATNGGAPFVESAPWKATSARIELSSFGFFDGSMQYAKDRAALSAAQLAALDGLRTQPGSGTSGSGDAETFDLTIVDADGTRANYNAAQNDPTRGANLVGTVRQATLVPFLATLTCMKATAARGCTAAPGAPVPGGCRAAVADDPGCLNGVFMPYACADVSITVAISKPGNYQIATVDCLETSTIKLLGADGATVIAEGSTGAKPSCSSLTHAFDAAGTFRLLLEKRNASGCTKDGAAGDMYLRVSPR